jgi:hypothetical protein
MNRNRMAEVGAMKVVGLAVEAALLGLLAFRLASRITGHPSAATAIGWMTTLAAVSVGAILWYVLARDDAPDLRPLTDAAHCSNCGHTVVDDWRLCPYCGTFVEDQLDSGAGRASNAAVR